MKTAEQDKKYNTFTRSQHKKSTSFSMLSQNSREIFKSPLLWRFVFVVVLAIASIQIVSIYVNAKQAEQVKINQLRQIASNAINPLLKTPLDQSLDAHIERILKTTIVTGLEIYPNKKATDNRDGRKFGAEITLPHLHKHQIDAAWQSKDKKRYEFISYDYKVSNRAIAVQIDASSVPEFLKSYTIASAINSVILTVFVSIILILAISRWLLDPILFMRNNLLEASKNPEKPKLPESPFNPEDEIGNAIIIAQNLIKQNSYNLQQTKSSAEDKIYKLAYFDPLTTLPNRAFFLQQVEREIKPSSDKPQAQFYVIAIDLDHFKDVNDSMGHNVGDAVLRSVGKRLKAGLPPRSLVSRTGEDEFAIMLEMHPEADTIESVSNMVLDLIRSEPIKVFNEDLQIRASAGVTSFPNDGQEAEQLVKHADIALNKAKEEGRNTFKEYSADFERAIQARFSILRDLRDAMKEDQLVLFYQPQLDLKSGRIIGAEALIRWWKPDDSKEGGRFVSPGEFIPIAEQTGLIVPMGEWIIRQACEDAKSWNEDYGLNMRVAINISGAQFEQSDITAFTKSTLEDLSLLPSKVELEVTESVFMDDIDQTIKTLENLHDLGVELAIDDFGTGYSSLSYLSQFPIDRLKIDQAFVRSALEDKNNASITRTVIALGHALNLKVIAEGVETKEHEDFLVSEGCDEVQGFRYSKPLPNARFIEFCKDYNGDIRSFSQI